MRLPFHSATRVVSLLRGRSLALVVFAAIFGAPMQVIGQDVHVYQGYGPAVWDQVSSMGLGLRDLAWGVGDLAVGYVEWQDYSISTAVATAYNFEFTEARTLPSLTLSRHWQSPVTRGYDLQTDNGRASNWDRAMASGQAFYSTCEAGASFGTIPVARGVYSDLNGTSRGAAGYAFPGFALAASPLGGVKGFAPARYTPRCLRSSAGAAQRSSRCPQYSEATLELARKILDPDRHTPLSLHEAQTILAHPELFEMSADPSVLARLFPDAPTFMIESMHRTYHGGSCQVPGSLHGRIVGRPSPHLTPEDLLGAAALADELGMPVNIFGSRAVGISLGKGRLPRRGSDLDAGVPCNDATLGMFDDLPGIFDRHGLSFDGFPEPADVGGITVLPRNR